MKDKATGDLFTGEIPRPDESNSRTDWRGIFREMCRLDYAGLLDDLELVFHAVAKLRGSTVEELKSWYKGAQASKWFDSNAPLREQSKAWEDMCVQELRN